MYVKHKSSIEPTVPTCREPVGYNRRRMQSMKRRVTILGM